MIPVRVTKIDPRATIPEYKTAGAAAFDLAVIENATIGPRESAFLRTGLVFGIPADHVLLIFSRSSLFKKHSLVLANGVGVIDADYCGPEDEILLFVRNPTDTTVEIQSGTRLAQGIVLPRPVVQFEEGPPLGNTRGGWGSTG
jgi:dUTP pyrophosphatase